jgi:hypothetical protein
MATRLIDLPFTRGLDQSVDETSLAPPGMTELVNYRMTRQGRLEHRLGVAATSMSASFSTAVGDRPDGNKPQGLAGGLLLAGGHGYYNNALGWQCVGSVPRFVPHDTFAGAQDSAQSFYSPSLASVDGFLVVAGRRAGPHAFVNVFDELTGVRVWSDQFVGDFGGTPNNVPRVVAAGAGVVVVTQNVTTGVIVAQYMDLTTLPLTGFPAFTTVVAATGSGGFDVAPISGSEFLLSYYDGTNAVIAIVSVPGLAITSSTTLTDGVGIKYTTCLRTTSSNHVYLAWLNGTTRNVCCAVLSTALVQVGTTQTAGVSASTALSASNFHPVIGRLSATSVVVGWTDSVVTAGPGATFQTFRTTFCTINNTASVGSTYGPIGGMYLASKPFRSTTPFLETITQPCVWLGNHNPNYNTELDRSYFLATLNASIGGHTTSQSYTLEMSAGPSVAGDAIRVMGATNQVCEVVQSTTLGEVWNQVAFNEDFRGLGDAVPQVKVQVYRFGDGARTIRSRTRAIVPANGQQVILGGAPRVFDGSRLIELGIPFGPTVVDDVPTFPGGMQQSSTYNYIFVIEYFDHKGQRHLSYASTPYTVTMGPTDTQVNFEILAPALWAQPNATDLVDLRVPVVRAYRTAANGTVYRYSPPTGSPNGEFVAVSSASGRVGSAGYQDVNSDADIAGNEAVYVQVGNNLSNYRAPPCTFGCEHEGRLVVGGGWNRKDVICSKLFFPGEGIQFTESAAFVINMSEECTGLASLDGSLVLFSERGIYTVSGDGPTGDGVGSFPKPRRLPGTVGCVDWRSIVTTEAGVFFRSLDGLYLLPRGLGPPSFVGAPIKDKLRLYPETLGATAATRALATSISGTDSEQVVCWLVGNAIAPTAVTTMVYSTAAGTWSETRLPEDAANLQNVIGTWRDLVNNTDVVAWARAEIAAATAGSLLVESPGTGYDQDISGSFEPLLNGSMKTGKVFPFGFGGRGTVKAVRLVGDCLHATTLVPTVYSDANTSGYTATTLTFAAAGRFAVELPLRQRDLAWLQVLLTDPTTGSANRGAGLRFNGLAIEVEMEPGMIRTIPGSRST